MTVCPYCGREVNDDFVFCPNCAKRLPQFVSASTPRPSMPMTNVTPMPVRQPALSKKSSKDLALGVVVVLFIIFVLVEFSMLMGTVIIISVILAILVWRSTKLREFTRAVGFGKEKLEKTAKDTEGLIKRSLSTAPSTEEVFVKMAKKLGIVTQGKTREEISQEITQREKKSKEV